jgi:hypothetical protein
MMTKRSITFGEYNTAAYGWTLCECAITKGQQMQTFIPVPGRFAPLDASTALTEGQPYYDNASLEVRLECSEGTREDRQALIEAFANYVDGRRLDIVHPDHPNRFLTGRAQVSVEYSDPTHCSVFVSVVCDPWLYYAEETAVTVEAATAKTSVTLYTRGRMPVVPEVTVAGTAAIEFGGMSWTLSKGTHVLPGLYLAPPETVARTKAHALTYTATGLVTFTYREAVLLV